MFGQDALAILLLKLSCQWGPLELNWIDLKLIELKQKIPLNRETKEKIQSTANQLPG